MPDQILPLSGLDQTGVILDTPAVALPPTAFSDVLNVRFKDGAVRKMEGEINIFPEIDVAPHDPNTTIKYVAWWANPNLSIFNRGYYLAIYQHAVSDTDDTQMDHAYLVLPDGTFSLKGRFMVDTEAAWQHTFFQGGFTLIVNNGLETPRFITDLDGNNTTNADGMTAIEMVPDFMELPGWDSYLVDNTLISDTYNAATNVPVFDLTQALAPDRTIVVTVNGVSQEVTADGSFTTPVVFTVATTTGDNPVTTITFRDTTDPANPVDTLNDGDVVRIQNNYNTPNITTGVIRSFGDFLVAGNLVERNGTEVVRSLTGVVRSSDVARPGAIPNNWNPFAAGVSTADEFVLADTGIVQDMAELQGNLVIYSNNSISVMRRTGNAAVPLSVAPLTDSYGAQTTGAVLEFDGQHVVVGSQDIYVFGGHPGSIQSISDGRVRRRFFDELNPLEEQRMFMVRYQQRDEIWVCYPTTESVTGECNRALIWNYRLNNWTIRQLDSVVSGNIGPVPGGGVPNSTISFEGTTGDNANVDPGTVEIQTLTSTTTILPPVARPTIFTIEVANFPETVSNGPEIFLLSIPTDFNSGIDNPLSLEFIVQNNGVFVTGYPFRVQLAANLTTPTEIVTSLTSDATFAMFYTAIVDEDDSTVVRITARDNLPDHTTHDLLINDFITTRSELTPSGMVINEMTETDGTFATFFPQSFVDAGPVVFVDATTGVDLPAGTQVQTGPEPGATDLFYRGLGDDAPFYGSAAAGDPLFPAASTTYTSINEPIRLMTAGRMYFRLLNAAGDPLPNQAVALVGHQSTTSDSTGTLAPPANIERVTDAGSPPIITFVSNRLDYDSSDGGTDDFTVQTNPVTFMSMLLGDLSGADRNILVARIIRDDFNNSGTFTATLTDSTVTVTSIVMEKRDLTDNNEFTIIPPMPVQEGIYVYGPGGIDVIAPTIEVTGPELTGNIRLGPPLMPGEPDTSVTHTVQGAINPNDIINTIGMTIDSRDGWMQDTDADDTDGEIVVRTVNFDAVPNDADGNPLTPTSNFTEATVQFQNMLAQRPITAAWDAMITTRGNIEGVMLGDVVASTRTGSGSTATDNTNQAGTYPTFNIPTFIGLLISLGSDTEQEFIVLRSGAISAGAGQTATEAATDWAMRLGVANRRLNVSSSGSNVTIQPRNYDELANFVVQAFFNDTAMAAMDFQTVYDTASTVDMDGTVIGGDRLGARVVLNTAFSDPLFMNPGSNSLAVSSGSLVVSAPTITTDFDTLRPWPTDEINPNQEYPILAARRVLDGTTTGTIVTVNKVIGADLGWSRPAYDADPMLNDVPAAYESYFERSQLPLSPEFNTEQVQSLALWADGSTAVEFRQAPHYNKIQLRATMSNNPGDPVDLSVLPISGNSVFNTFEVSEEYKLDTRIHGRFSNYRITDMILDETNTNTFPAMDTTTFTDKTFNPFSEWRVSGIQIEFAVGGRR